MAELQKNPVFILRFDGQDLKEFFLSPDFDLEMVDIFSKTESTSRSLHTCIITALQQLTLDHGLPPCSDPWVFSHIVDPALKSLSELDRSPSQKTFMEEFKKLIWAIIERLHENPIIVAHTLKAYDGSGIRRLLCNNAELKKLLELTWREMSKGSDLIEGREIARVAFGRMATSADLPCYGAVDRVDAVVDEVFGVADEGFLGLMQKERFKKMMADILGSLMARLESDPILISSNFVVHEPHLSPSKEVDLSE